TAAFDGKKYLQGLIADVQEVHYEGRVYYKTPKVSPAVAFLGVPLCAYMPDERTLVIDSEENLRRVIKDGPRPRPSWLTADHWQRVERGLLAVAINLKNPKIARYLETQKEEAPIMAPLFDHVRQLVGGVDCRDDFVFRILASCETEEGGVEVEKAAQ